MLTGIFDSHAHYDDARFNEDRDELLLSMKKNGVDNIMNIGVDIQTSENSIKLAEQYDFMYCSVGVHPWVANDIPDNFTENIREMAKNKKVKAIGEIGLDYHYEDYSAEKQQEIFRKQLILAQELNLPVIIHNRDAHSDTMNILKQHNVKGVVHCFSGSAEMAKELVKMGFYIGFTGVITFKNARRAVEAVNVIPLDRLLVETDCPYMAPEPNRGKRCDSTMLPYIITKMAEIKNISPEEMTKISAENTRKIFNI